MPKTELAIEPARWGWAKLGFAATGFAVELLADPTAGPFDPDTTDKLRAASDVFNHTGNIALAAIGGVFGSFMAATAEKGVSDFRGTQDEVSLTRMDYVMRGAGIAAAATASYLLEKWGGQIDWQDVAYSLPFGVATSALFSMGRRPGFDATQPPAVPPEPPHA